MADPSAYETELAKGPAGLPRAVEGLLKTDPARLPSALAAVAPEAFRAVAELWKSALAGFRVRLKEIQDAATAKGLDEAMGGLAQLLHAVWHLESKGVLWQVEDEIPAANRFADAAEQAMRKIAPPLPKKVKLDAPLRKIPPLSEARVVDAFDSMMLLRALQEIGDYTRQPDKDKDKFQLFMDDWRRVTFEGARLPSWAKARELVAAAGAVDERIPGRRFSRDAVVRILESNEARLKDKITRIPDLSMLACEHCGRYDGRERVRCAVCSRMFCGRCRARTTELCLADYAVPKYGSFAPEVRLGVSAAARAICGKFRLDEHTRDDNFVRALQELGVETVFADANPDGGEEVQDNKGKWHLRLKHREASGTKRLLFAAIARAHFRGLETPPDFPEAEALFVDTCLGVPIEDALSWPRRA